MKFYFNFMGFLRRNYKLMQVIEDFYFIILRIKVMVVLFGGLKGEIVYVKEYEFVWFKGKRFILFVWGGIVGEE